MFRVQDKYLYRAKIIFLVDHILALVVLLIGVIAFYWAIPGRDSWLEILYGTLMIIGGLFVIFISWIFHCLFLSFLWDVKKIRNRLYDENDVKLNRYFDDVI